MASTVTSVRTEISQSFQLSFDPPAIGRVGRDRVSFSEATLILTAERSADGTSWISKGAGDGAAPVLELLIPDAREIDCHGIAGRLYFPAWPIHYGRAKIQLDALENRELIDSIIRDFVVEFWKPLTKESTVG